MQGGADELLLLMEKKAKKYIKTRDSSKLQDLLRWAHRATDGSAGNFKSVGKRADAIANAYVIANANTIANAIDSARKLEKLEIFNNVNWEQCDFVGSGFNSQLKHLILNKNRFFAAIAP